MERIVCPAADEMHAAGSGGGDCSGDWRKTSDAVAALGQQRAARGVR